MIEFKQVTKTFYKKGQALTALHKVSLHVPEGKIVGIIGASGAGKSTLIRCVNDLEKPTSGDVIVDGQSLVQLSASALNVLRHQIGMIFQHFNLLSSHTVFENIAFPLKLTGTPKIDIEKRVSELLALVSLENKRYAYPANLSGGQKQRVAIARALASHPKILLCDEATSALDPTSTRAILTLLKDINQRLHITILLITHEMEVAKAICDEVAILSNGTLVEKGTVASIFSNPKTDIAKQFIESSLHMDVPVSFLKRLQQMPGTNKHPLVRLHVNGTLADIPVLSEAARLFDVDNHIVSARIDSAGEATFGVLLIEIRGAKESVQKAIDFFKERKFNTTVLGYV